jgi:hypothetical protein
MASADSHVFIIGDIQLLRLEERARENQPTVYTLTFKDCEPEKESIDAGIDMLRIFADLDWDFELLVDMRESRIDQQLQYIASYSRLILMIRNKRCMRCTVLICPVLCPLVAVLLRSAISTITSALGVECSIQEMKRD